MAGTSLSVVSSATANRGGVPVWTTIPVIYGCPEVDRLLTCTIPANAYSYTPTLDWARPRPSWQWKRDGVAISGATDPTYVPVLADQGKALTCTVTLTGESAASATSGSTVTYWDYDFSGLPGDYYVSVSNVIGANGITTTYDLNALGVWKTSATTGSMTAGSPTLTVADASGFTIGDPIIVATGGEAGAGAWGTVGVGGTWPALSYANATAMNADTSQAVDKLCYLQSTGFIYYWSGSAWVGYYTGPDNDDFYYARAMPKALVTTIINKVGNTLTLNANAVVNTTNAHVYFDCAGRADSYVQTKTNVAVYASAGSYAFSVETVIGSNNKKYLFYGDGPTSTILFSPDGCPNLSLTASLILRGIFRDFGMVGNHKMNSWGVDQSSESRLRESPIGFVAENCHDVLMDNLHSGSMVSSSCIFRANSYQCAIRNCYTSSTVPERAYNKWCYNIVDSYYSSIIDCEVDADWIETACEHFRSLYGNTIRFTGRNATMSSNTSGGLFIDGTTLVYNAGSQYDYSPTKPASLQNWTPLRTLFDINSNIGNFSGIGTDLVSNGVLVYNLTLTMEGYLDATYETRSKIIIIATNYSGVFIKNGTVTVPVRGIDIETYGVQCDGDNATISDVRFIGFTGGYDCSVWFRYYDTLGHGRVYHCVGETILAHVSQRNQTNAEYIASGGV